MTSSEGQSRLISLKHITQPAAPKPTRVAWPGGKIGSNKDEAVARFLEKKRERGDSLTAEQLELLKRFHSSEAAAEAERIIAGDAPAAAPAPAAGHKRRRDGKSGAPHIVTTTGSSKKSQGAAKASVVVALSLKAGGPSGKPKPVAVAAPAPAPAAPVFSVADKLSMSLDQLAALRKTTSPAAAAVPSGAQKKRK